ncbi:MAG: hypothetical protein NXI14_08840 [bacterium]|nr:hypothetical protein [bacterium]
MSTTAFPTFGKIAARFSASAFPMMSRRAYAWELRSACFLPFALACVEGGVIGTIAKKAFEASDLVIAILAAAPALSNIASFLWTRAFHGRNRVRAILVLQAIILSCVGVIAMAPISPLGVWMIVFAVLAARFAMAGIIVARSDVWRANYTRVSRSRAAGNLSMMMTLIIGLSGLLIGLVMDLEQAPAAVQSLARPVLGLLGIDPTDTDSAFRIFYVFAILAGLIGIWAFSHVRWRGGRAQAKTEFRQRESKENTAGPLAMYGVLRDDLMYRRYMGAMFLLGISNIAAMPVFIIALNERFELSYTSALLLTHVIPVLLPVLVIPFWAKVLDGMHIVQFRTYHSWFFIVANAMMAIGFAMESLAVLTIARVILGVAFGGGVLAWNLGHHDFARRELASVYMGIHATLTGVRGALGPFIGVVLYAGLTIPAWTGLDKNNMPPVLTGGIGTWTFLVFSGSGTVGAFLFARLLRDMRELGIAEPKDA